MNMNVRLLIAFAVLAGALGCTPQQAEVSTQEKPKEPANGSQVKSQAELPALKESYLQAKKSYEVDKANEAAAAAFAQSAAEYAYGLMLGDGVPREKYPLALSVADEALAVEPNNDLAKTTKMQIEAIYEGMGKTPPKVGG